MKYIIILPTQLFEYNDIIEDDTTIFLIEHPVYFTEYSYHKMKLVLHRATMRYYNDYLIDKYKCKVKYIEFNKKLDSVYKLLKNKDVHIYDPVEHMIEEEFKKISKKYNINFIIYDTPLFLQTNKKLNEYMNSKKSLVHNSFYIWQRRELDILIINNKPKGGKWSYDIKNRLPFPTNYKETFKVKKNKNKYITEAKKYINKYFKNNTGEDELYLPIDHKGVKNHFKDFIKKRINNFGPYEDAMDENINFGNHSVLSPLMNIGLITPEYVINKVIKMNIPIQSLEGYIRQLIGWREYCRLLYKFKRIELEKPNHFNNKKKIDENIWYKGTEYTHIPPIDHLIKKTIKLGYLHHIERLMYIGNYMLITGIHPKEAFIWYQTMFLDSYHVFMYPNVYGMSQYSAGNIMMTRPYFSSSSYIDRMSNFRKKKNIYPKIIINNTELEWYEVWDCLYYNFINNNKSEFKKNYAISQQVSHWVNKTKSEQENILEIAKYYLRKY